MAQQQGFCVLLKKMGLEPLAPVVHEQLLYQLTTLDSNLI